MSRRADLSLTLPGILLIGAAQALAAQAPPPARVTETSFDLGGGAVMRYAISVPEGDAPGEDPRPLVLALHPGGRAEYYGSSFMRSIVEPALRSWGAVIVAPDVPDRSWATPRSEQALLGLVERVLGDHAIDRRRVLVTGFSMGGQGTWYMASHHPDLFTGAIVLAGSPDGVDLGSLGDTPLYLIHSPDDEVVPYEPVEEAYLSLAGRGHPIELRVLPGASHYMMGAYVAPLRLGGEWMLERWQGAP